MTAWEDAVGNTLAPVWPDEASATAENEADADSGDGPQRLELCDLAPRLQHWAAQDVLLAVHPLKGSIGGTFSVAEFVAQLLEAVPRDGSANEHPWVPHLAPLRRVLP